MTSYIIEQKITAFANQYRVYTATDGAKGELIAFAHQKRLAMREKIEFFADENRKELVFTVRAEKVMDIHGKFIVSGATGEELGVIRKAFGSSLLRSTWEILKKDEVAVIVRERSQFKAIFRRVWDVFPFVGEFPFLFKYHFDFINPANDQRLASHSKTTLWRDHYKLEIEDEALLQLTNWQTLVAQAVLLDALQGR